MPGLCAACKTTTPSAKAHAQIPYRASNGISSEFTLHLSDSAMVRELITVRTKAGSVPDFVVREIEKQIVKAARRWEDDLYDELNRESW